MNVLLSATLHSMKRLPAWLLLSLLCASPAGAAGVLLEAENFANRGGWDVDQQFMETMGSPYVLAHGLGVPVKDATTTVRFPAAGKYRLWVRTKDWVATWNAPGTPGKFQIIFNGATLPETFGTKGAAWHWHDGGVVGVSAAQAQQSTVVLHDLTGFEGRCDALYFSADATPPPDAGKELDAFRRKALGLPMEPVDGGTYDLVVVGGGIAGTAAAVSAARNGLTVALIQDRPVLGGNASSEVRVWPEGHTRQRPFRHVGEIVEELCPPQDRAVRRNAGSGGIYDDDRRTKTVLAEPRITLMLENRMIAADAPDHTVRSVTVQHTRTAERKIVRGRLFADCTGDAALGFLVGADYEMSQEGNMGSSNLWNVMDQANQKDVIKCECKDKDALTAMVSGGNVAAPFPRCPWAIDLTDKPFPGREQLRKGDLNGLGQLGGWFWESGFDKDPIRDIENIRDLNMRAMYGAWDALKNVDKLLPNHRLGWSAFIAGKRESRRLLGDIVLSGIDFRKSTVFPDGAYPCSWHIDVHTPDDRFEKGLGKDAFISTFTRGKEYEYAGPYWAPYRTLYSRNVGNLFMAGRNVSVNREALGAVRVMRTTGMMGEIVGKAAWIAVRHSTTPRGVHDFHLAQLKELMSQSGVLRREKMDGPLALPPGATIPEEGFAGINPAKLSGIVIDDSQATLRGDWSDRGSLPGFVGAGYVYSTQKDASAIYSMPVKDAATYEVRVNWRAHENRSAVVAVEIAGKTFTFSQKEEPQGEQHFQTLGEVALTAGTQTLTFRNTAVGAMHVDAVQLVRKP